MTITRTNTHTAGLAKIKAATRTLLFTVSGLMFAAAANAATIQFNPDALTVAPNDLFSIGIEGTGFDQGSAGGSVVVGWDPAVLTLNLATATAEWDFPFIGTIDNVAGTVEITVATFFNPSAGADFGIATLDFMADAVGDSSNTIGLSTISPWFWSDGDTEYDPVPTTLNGTVTVDVNEVPLPPALLLFGSGILGLVSAKRRRKV